MQAYEHIMATMIKLSKDTKNSKGLTLDENLEFIKRYGAYFTYPDSIRALVRLSTNKAFRQPSHMSEGAWMEFIVGEELKNSENGFPIEKMYIPEGLELKAADGPTNLKLVSSHNKELLKTREGQAIYEHLRQDLHTDRLFQGHIASCYIDENEVEINGGESYSLYGVNTKAGLARFNQTGKIVPMSEFREVVATTQQLTTFELFKKLRDVYPSISFEQIQDAVFTSYDENYPEVMMNAKQYAVPTKEEQNRILHALDNDDYNYYENLKNILVGKGAFKNIGDVDKQITQLINQVISLGYDEKDKFNLDFI